MNHIELLEKAFVETFKQFLDKNVNRIKPYFLKEIIYQTIIPCEGNELLDIYRKKLSAFTEYEIERDLLMLIAFQPELLTTNLLLELKSALKEDKVFVKFCLKSASILKPDLKFPFPIMSDSEFLEEYEDYDVSVIGKIVFDLAVAVLTSKREQYVENLFYKAKKDNWSLFSGFLGLLNNDELLKYFDITNHEEGLINIIVRQKRYDLLDIVFNKLTTLPMKIIASAYLNYFLDDNDVEVFIKELFERDIDEKVYDQFIKFSISWFQYDCFLINCLFQNKIILKRLVFSKNDWIRERAIALLSLDIG